MEVPEFFAGGSEFSAAENHRLLFDQKPADHFAIDDLLDFSNSVDDDSAMISAESFFDNVAGNSSDSSTLAVVDSCNSSFSADPCVPIMQYDDLAELEWLSNFVEDSFSADMDLQSLQFLSTKPTTTTTTTKTPFPKPLTPETSSSSSSCSEPPRNAPFLPHETSLPGKARSKRSRAAPGDWTTRLLHLVHPDSGGDVAKHARNKSVGPGSGSGSDSGGRKCLHCAAEKTPQWRTGPTGPKTLCNACGVRYKSGRLVPEYRPASSPTFVSAKHSNSHRKVMELRRQKELHTAQHRRHFLGQTSIFGVSDGCDDFLIHHHGGSDFGRLI